jgi:hypothetical protein
MEESLQSHRVIHFAEPALTMAGVNAALRSRVEQSRLETAIDQGRVPVVTVPAEINGPAAIRLALQASANIRN